MNKDTQLCKFRAGNGVVITERYVDVPFLNDLELWINERLHPFGRENILKLMKYANIYGIESFVKITKCISLNDCFWAKSVGDNTKWDSVSPYKNKLSRIIADIALENRYTGGSLKSPTPEPATQGNFNKCWRRINGEIYLIKSSHEKWSDMTGNEGYSEVLVNQLERALGYDYYVRYGCLTKVYRGDYEKKYVFTRCKLFTSENVGFLPVCYSFASNKSLGGLYSIFAQLGCSNRYREMLLLDALVLNVDRHYGNFGFLFDTNTLKLTGMAPIFDNNLALLPTTQVKGKTSKEQFTAVQMARPCRFDGSFIELGRLMLHLDDRENGDLRQRLTRARDFQFVRDKQLELLSDERLEFLNKLIHYQIKQILG